MNITQHIIAELGHLNIHALAITEIQTGLGASGIILTGSTTQDQVEFVTHRVTFTTEGGVSRYHGNYFTATLELEAAEDCRQKALADFGSRVQADLEPAG